MIEKMHERTNGPVFKIIFALVSLSFVLTGVSGSLVGNDANVVAKVNGEKIDLSTFNTAKNQAQRTLLDVLGNEAYWLKMEDPQYAQEFTQDILNRLVNERVLRQYIDKLKLNVSVEQIKSHIVNDPSFQKDGKFSNELYQAVLRQNNLSPDHFAALVAEGVLSSQLQTGIFDTAFNTPAEQNVLAKLLLQQRQFSIAKLSLSEEANKQTATDTEVQAYFDAHKADFVEPEKLKVEFFSFTPADVAKSIKVSDADIASYYEQNQTKFMRAGETRLAHIQVASLEQAKQIAQQLQAGEDFANIAKSQSADKLSAAQGGDLGWAKEGVFPAAFEQAANALQVGQVSQPVEINGAFHLVKVLERKPASQLALAEVKTQISEQLSQEAAIAKYSELLNEINNKSSELSVSELAALAGVKSEQTAQFKRDDEPTALKDSKILSALYAKEFRVNGELSEAIDLSNANVAKTFFMKVTDFQASRPQTLDEAKAAATQAVKREKAEKIITAQADEFVAKLAKGEKITATFSPKQTVAYNSAYVSNPELAQTLFSMPKPVEGASYKATRVANGDLLVIALDQVTDGKLADFAPMAPSLALEARKALEHDIIQDLRARTDVEFNDEALSQSSAE